jgi:hypothetical protein
MLGMGLTSPAIAQQRIGVSGAVNPEATGIAPSAAPRRLVLGQDIVFNERISTGPEGQTQVLFVDQSALSVGPNSDMVIDEFVYDPAAGTGKLAANMTRGVNRNPWRRRAGQSRRRREPRRDLCLRQGRHGDRAERGLGDDHPVRMARHRIGTGWGTLEPGAVATRCCHCSARSARWPGRPQRWSDHHSDRGHRRR